jgi:N-acetylglucosaminyldiphosphoundecaprenol N-acetyl-beta-D-mannosaminyltransferase
MINRGRHNVLGVMIDAVDYEEAVRQIAAAAHHRTPFAATALAVHGVMTGYRDPAHSCRLNQFDLVVPDGQPVRWTLDLLYKTHLPDRVYGPNLMLAVCQKAERSGVGVYLYGSTRDVLERLVARLKSMYPGLQICGYEPSRFRRLTSEEKAETVARIRASGAQITFVGLGCPRQEVWVHEYHDALSMPVIAVGAAFDFHAGTSAQAPQWMQNRGLEWMFRLGSEPRRLWRRYLLLNPWYVAMIAAQGLHLRQFEARASLSSVRELGLG